jgi:Spy/CpxP family protein refolding chaperone
MKTTLSLIICALILGAGLSCSSSKTAQQPKAADPQKVADAALADDAPRNPLDYFGTLRRLRLTDAQHKALRALMDNHLEKVDALTRRATDSQWALRKAMTAEPMNEKLVRKHSDDLGKVMSDLAVEHTRLRSEILAQLNRDQRELFLAMERKGEEVNLAMTKFSEFVRFINRVNQLDRQARQ